MLCVCAKSLQSCLTLCDPMDCSPPGSPVHGILQARILEWVAMPSSRGSSPPRDETCISYVSCIGRQVLYHWCHLGSPHITSYAPKCPCPSQSLVISQFFIRSNLEMASYHYMDMINSFQKLYCVDCALIN